MRASGSRGTHGRRPPQLDNQRSFHIVSGPRAVVFHPSFPISSQKIESEAISLFINDIKQLCFQKGELCGINLTFENGVLYALPVVEANLGYTPQSSDASFRGGRYIVGD
jgi:hypothetical protein